MSFKASSGCAMHRVRVVLIGEKAEEKAQLEGWLGCLSRRNTRREAQGPILRADKNPCCWCPG